MEMKTRKVPFDLAKAKSGAKVVTRCGYPVRMSDFNVKNKDGYTLLGIIDIKGNEVPFSFLKNGCRSGTETQSEYDLFIEEEVKTRPMTNQELTDWLRDCPEEHREWGHSGTDSVYPYPPAYFEDERNELVGRGVLIRRNHGEWEEPITEV